VLGMVVGIVVVLVLYPHAVPSATDATVPAPSGSLVKGRLRRA